MRFEQYKNYLAKFLDVKSKVTELVQSIEELIATADDVSALSYKEENSLKFHIDGLEIRVDQVYNKKHFVEP